MHAICTECLSEPKEVCSAVHLRCASWTQRQWPSTQSHLRAQRRAIGTGLQDWSGLRVKPSLIHPLKPPDTPTQPPSAKSRCSTFWWLECHFLRANRWPPFPPRAPEGQGEPRRAEPPGQEWREGGRKRDQRQLGPKGREEAGRGLGFPPSARSGGCWGWAASPGPAASTLRALPRPLGPPWGNGPGAPNALSPLTCAS